MKKTFFTIMVALLCCGLLAACGNDKTPEATQQTEDVKKSLETTIKEADQALGGTKTEENSVVPTEELVELEPKETESKETESKETEPEATEPAQIESETTETPMTVEPDKEDSTKIDTSNMTGEF